MRRISAAVAAAASSLVACVLAPGTVHAQAPSVALAPDTSWVVRSALYEVNVRDFSAGGNLTGVTAGLARIQATGADVIWLMPIFPIGVLNAKGPVGSPYAVRDYDAINPDYGTAADLRALVRAAHARRMKVILDWVPDHTSWDAVWIKTHPEYYVHDSSGQPVVPRDLQGHPTDWTDVAQLDYRNAGLRTAMIASLRHWLVDFDLDGYRMDVAHFIPPDFWAEASTALRAAVRRPILMLAEAGELETHRVGFDLSYGWDGYGRLKAVWRGAPVDSFVLGVVADQRAMPPGGMRMRFTTNHDETGWDNPPITLFGSPAGARAAFVAMALMPGRPLLYDGQEVESPQKLGLFERETVDWSQPCGATAVAFYARVVRLARTDPAFLRGDLRRIRTSDSTDVIAYGRGAAVVLVNARSHAARFTVAGFDVAGARDLLTGSVVRGDTLALPAYGAMVLKR
ncbi:MAG TPA: alpha-amylase family glycosyl hydrolase [Gemmatimonadales bacterium]|nr:alpha-amylase family glycosyl hydrolase [Gemmatimonadales bacterium]